MNFLKTIDLGGRYFLPHQPLVKSLPENRLLTPLPSSSVDGHFIWSNLSSISSRFYSSNSKKIRHDLKDSPQEDISLVQSKKPKSPDHKKQGLLSRARAYNITGKDRSSTEWLQRKLSDPYTRLAHEQGLAARSAFKLDQILNRIKPIRANLVVDLGAAPGGWTQMVHRHFPRARIISIDKKPMNPIPNTTQVILDFSSEEAPRKMAELLRDNKIQLLLSDMAPSFTGQHEIDHLRLIGLAELAFEFGKYALAPDACAIFKINRGGTESEFKRKLENYFQRVKYIKPDASFKSSSEIFVVATGFSNPMKKNP